MNKSILVIILGIILILSLDSFAVYKQFIVGDNPVNVSKSRATVLAGDIPNPATPTYSVGSIMHLQLSGCSAKDVNGRLVASYVNYNLDTDVQIIPLATLGITNKKGCTSGNFNLRLPSQVTEGHWIINFTERINGSKQVVNMDSNEFEVR